MKYNSKDLTKVVLVGLGVLGAVVLVGAVIPGLFAAFNKKKILGNGFDKDSFTRKIKYLKNKRFIKIKINPDNTCNVELAERGRRKILKYSLDDLRIKPMRKWDCKWRFVMFDIPDRHRKVSNAFREKLKELGFFQFQKSIWTYPYPIRDEIEFMSEIFNIRRFINTGEIVNLDDDIRLRDEFGLF